MTHTMHLEEGIILDSFQTGESGRILKILTRDYGIVVVVATGVREQKSKMRGSLSILQVVNFEYVEGREMNRLTGIHEVRKFPDIFVLEKRRVVSNIVNFVSRTVLGETKNENLYNSFLEGLEFVDGVGGEVAGGEVGGEKGEAFFAAYQDLESIEIIWLIKILVSLGYWSEGDFDQFNNENLIYLNKSENKKQVALDINKSIKSTHL